MAPRSLAVKALKGLKAMERAAEEAAVPAAKAAVPKTKPAPRKPAKSRAQLMMQLAETYAPRAVEGAKDIAANVAARLERAAGEVAPPAVPQKTTKAYKLFKTKKSSPGELYPLFVDANMAVPQNQWVEATAGPLTEAGKVKSNLGPLAYRPGWHAGDLPVATHIGGKSERSLKAPDYRPDNQVWAEVELPDDVDWQSLALERARRNKIGDIIASTAHITDQVPYGGHYRYKTNPNMTGNWLIGGGMKVNRVLTPEEVRAINEEAGVFDLPSLTELLAARKARGGRVSSLAVKRRARAK